MVSLDCAHETVDGVTLVEVRLESDGRERVTLEPTHDGPIWPPRRQGVPEQGWHEDGWTGVVSGDEPVALGYATPAEPADPPVRIADRGPAPDEHDAPGPRAVLRALGDPRPPRDAVEPDGGRPTTDTTGRERPAHAESATDAPESPDVAPALADIEARIERAEALAAVDSVATAREAVAEEGGIEAVRSLVARLDRDRRHLDRLHRWSDDLRERAAVDVPLEDLARLV